MLKLPYSVERPSEEVSCTAQKIVSLLIASELSYEDADNALATAQMLLGQNTKPTAI